MSEQNEPRVVTSNLYAVLTTPIYDREKILEALPDHLEHQVSLEERGIMFAAGPLFEKDDAPPRAGLIIIRANSFAEADEIAGAIDYLCSDESRYMAGTMMRVDGGFVLQPCPDA